MTFHSLCTQQTPRVAHRIVPSIPYSSQHFFLGDQDALFLLQQLSNSNIVLVGFKQNILGGQGIHTQILKCSENLAAHNPLILAGDWVFAINSDKTWYLDTHSISAVGLLQLYQSKTQARQGSKGEVTDIISPRDLTGEGIIFQVHKIFFRSLLQILISKCKSSLV